MAKRFSNLCLVEHPLIAHMITEARDRQTDSSRFRQLLSGIGAMIAYEATRDLETVRQPVQTPLEQTEGARLKMPVTVVPILRAGLVMADGVLSVLPEAQVGHIGMFRDEQSLRPVSYYEKLPAKIGLGPALLVDPMLATGGSAMAGVQLLQNRGCKDVRLICLVASPEGVQRLHDSYPQARIFAGAVDRQLDERGYILPGLGDAGDRLFGTLDEQ